MVSCKEAELIANLVTREAIDREEIIEIGWLALKRLAIPADATQVQIDEMRMAFFAGATHLFASIMTVLDPGSEETEDDMRRMDAIQNELKKFEDNFKLRIQRPEGSA
jgi:hypothetical protein